MSIHEERVRRLLYDKTAQTRDLEAWTAQVRAAAVFTQNLKNGGFVAVVQNRWGQFIAFPIIESLIGSAFVTEVEKFDARVECIASISDGRRGILDRLDEILTELLNSPDTKPELLKELEYSEPTLRHWMRRR